MGPRPERNRLARVADQYDGDTVARRTQRAAFGWLEFTRRPAHHCDIDIAVVERTATTRFETTTWCRRIGGLTANHLMTGCGQFFFRRRTDARCPLDQ